MRETEFQQFARTANQLPSEQKQKLMALLCKSDGSAFVQPGSNKNPTSFSLFGNHSLSGIRRLY